MSSNPFNTIKPLSAVGGNAGMLYSLPALQDAGFDRISRLPVSIRIVLESLLRNCNGLTVTEQHIRDVANWEPKGQRDKEIPFHVSRVVLQDYTGLALLADLASMRSSAERAGSNPNLIEPQIPVCLVVDHSVPAEHYGMPGAIDLNMKLEFQRNAERYRFVKWCMQAFGKFEVVPPGFGIVHQVNLEYLAKGVVRKENVYYPDSLVGTDSHTTMINSLGVVGWGVGGIEAEAAALGQPTYFLTPDVIGVHLHGKLKEGITATDAVLTLVQLLRRHKVVGKFVEFFGEGVSAISVPDRATISNMAPEYGATMGFFPIDEHTVEYFKAVGRTTEETDAFKAYYEAQGMYGIPAAGDIDYTDVIEFDLSSVTPTVAGPRRPQDRLDLNQLKSSFARTLQTPVSEGGFGRDNESLVADASVNSDAIALRHGDILMASITSCTNTSNPSVLLAAGLLAKKAVEKGLTVKKHIKTTLIPGSKVVGEYLAKAGLQSALDQLGFTVAAYGCGVCAGNSGTLASEIEQAIAADDLICAAVLSGNRNFEARIHPSLRANYLMSPPLVIAFAIAGNVLVNVDEDHIGIGADGTPVMLKDIWPSNDEISEVMHHAMDPETYRRFYSDFTKDNKLWNAIPSVDGDVYNWTPSTYIAEPPFLSGFTKEVGKSRGDITGARTLAILGDSITTDHISPAGIINKSSPAGQYLTEHGVAEYDFNTYGARRANHEVMVRGTFANVRLKNALVGGKEGGITTHFPSKREMSIYEASLLYKEANVPLVIFAGEEYGTGSSRDWAAKGTSLLGVRAVIAKSFERIHRSNLVGMGILPLQFMNDEDVGALKLTGEQVFDITGIDGVLLPMQEIQLVVHYSDASERAVRLLLRIDTPIEVKYYENGGILPYVQRAMLSN